MNDAGQLPQDPRFWLLHVPLNRDPSFENVFVKEVAFRREAWNLNEGEQHEHL